MLDDAHLTRRLNHVINLAGKRYETRVNIEVENVVKSLQATNREEPYVTLLLRQAYKIQKQARYLPKFDASEDINADAQRLIELSQRLSTRLIAIKSKSRIELVRWKDLRNLYDECQNLCFELEERLRQHYEVVKTENTKHQSYRVRDLRVELYPVEELITDKNTRVFNTPRTLILGEAGIGKTHLLCDYAQKRLNKGTKTLIFLGQEFTTPAGSPDPILCMSKLLGFPTKNEFIKSLKALAKRQNERVSIIVDATNEADSIDWTQLKQLASIEGISLILSVRSGYEFVIKDISSYTPIRHTGFAELEWTAIEQFFKSYKVRMPEIPVVDPEFKNPLFLKLFCESYSRKRKSPRGHGATHVFEIYVEKQSKIILQKLGLTSLPRDYLWRNVIKKMGLLMATNSTSTLQKQEILNIIKADSNLKNVAGDLIQLMESDSLLLKYPSYTKSFKRNGFKYGFPYQRFSDHLIIRSVLTENNIEGQDAERIAISFFSNSDFLEKQLKRWEAGLLEALAIQIPERCNGAELITIIPDAHKSHELVRQAFLEGLRWRSTTDPNTGKSMPFRVQDCLDYMNRYFRSSQSRDEVIHLSLDVSSIPGHSFNAEWLHRNLIKQPLGERDAWFQKLLLSSSEYENAVSRLQSWCLSTITRAASDESISLAGIALGWTLSSVNMTVRNRSTRAMIALFYNRTNLLTGLIGDKFDKCNDPYIKERLMAVAYGCFAINPDPESLADFYKYVIKTNKYGYSTPNALVDDYAKGIVELYRSSIGKRRLFIPRFTTLNKYKFPNRIPAMETLKKKYHDGDNYDFSSIWQSLMYGEAAIADFGNYTMNGAIGVFSKYKLGEKPPEYVRTRYDKFVDHLSKKQRKLYDDYTSAKFSAVVRFSYIFDSDDEVKKKKDAERIAKAEKLRDETFKTFEKSLLPFNRKRFKKLEAERYKSDPTSRSTNDFNLDIARRWIFKRVLQLGWSPDLHGDFEKYYTDNGIDRARRIKTERIGKKYQWIGLHEIAAYLGANYYLKQDHWTSETYEKYRGAYQLGIRDFDPTINPLWLSSRQPFSEKDDSWWVPKYKSFSIADWKKVGHDVPKLKDFIFHNFEDVEYLSFYNWNTFKGPNDPPEDPEQYNYPELWIHMNGYIVHQKDLDKVIEYCTDKEFYNNILPTPNEESGGIYLAEFKNSDTYRSFFMPSYKRSDWDKATDTRPFDLLLPIEAYSSSYFDRDASIPEHFNLYMPNNYLKKKLKLKPAGEVGVYDSVSSNLKFLDPGIRSSSGREALLVTKNEFIEWLKKENLTVFWTILGEKLVIQHHGDNKNNPRLEVHGFGYLDDNYRFVESVRHPYRER